MSEFLEKIKSDPGYRKAFDKGVSAGIVFTIVVSAIIMGIIKIFI